MWTIFVTYEGQEGSYPESVTDDVSDAQVLEMVWRALQNHDIPNITTVTRDLTGYKVKRKFETQTIHVRPEVVYG